MTEAEGGMEIYSPTQPEGQAIMKQKNLTFDELSAALFVFQQYNYELKIFLGIDETGFYGSEKEDWEDVDYLTFIPWVQIYEILGKVGAGSTEEFMEGGAEYN